MYIAANAPAFPSHGSMGEVCETGLTIRADLAARAMQGLLADPSCANGPEAVAKWSVRYADALIAELNQTQEAAAELLRCAKAALAFGDVHEDVRPSLAAAVAKFDGGAA